MRERRLTSFATEVAELGTWWAVASVSAPVLLLVVAVVLVLV